MNWIFKIVAINFAFWVFIFLSVVFLWSLTQATASTGGRLHGLNPLDICIGLSAALLLAAIVVAPFWVIFKRAGAHPALSILMIVPFVNLVTLYLVAFSKGSAPPAQKS
jgi:uncharacterized membrane protein